MLISKPFMSGENSIHIPERKIDGNIVGAGQNLRLRFSRVIMLDYEHKADYIRGQSEQYTFGESHLVVCYARYPSIDLFGWSRGTSKFFIQVSMQPYSAKIADGRDMASLFQARQSLPGGRSVYNYIRDCLPANSLPAVRAGQNTFPAGADCYYLYITSSVNQGVVMPRVDDRVRLVHHPDLPVFDSQLSKLF
jgi:hypothetical protein